MPGKHKDLSSLPDNYIKKLLSLPVIPALGRLKQEDQDFKTSLSYIVSLRQPGLPKKQTTKAELVIQVLRRERQSSL